MKDALGERIKSQYEDRSRFSLPRRTYTILRLDGKAFHTYTKGLTRPFDQRLFDDMDEAIISLCKEVQGVVFAYTQSDEISLLLTDFASPGTCAWFDGNIQKMASVSASILTAEFNLRRNVRAGLSNNIDKVVCDKLKLAYFDARVFTIPDPTEVYNYFVWRQQDCIRNSVSMVAQSLYSHKELTGKSQSEMIEMICAKGESWGSQPKGFTRGRLIVKDIEYFNYPTGMRYGSADDDQPSTRSVWKSKAAWKFTEQPEILQKIIPQYE